ncbi:unnamed protein product [Ectocarpus sp. CCAP 1310/34]|nr:unnamed protein product [Ectocarpus sp. CCAP 1310/34]
MRDFMAKHLRTPSACHSYSHSNSGFYSWMSIASTRRAAPFLDLRTAFWKDTTSCNTPRAFFRRNTGTP